MAINLITEAVLKNYFFYKMFVNIINGLKNINEGN